MSTNITNTMCGIAIFIAFAVGVIITLILKVTFNNYEHSHKSSQVKTPGPPRLFASALSYYSGNPVENMDVTLKSSCSETFDYIIKYVDKIPITWCIMAMKYAVQLSGTVGQETSYFLDQLEEKPTKDVIVFTAQKLKELVC